MYKNWSYLQRRDFIRSIKKKKKKKSKQKNPLHKQI